MPHIVNFTFFGAVYFSVNIFELCFGCSTVTWKQFNSLGSCFQLMIGGTIVAFSPGLIFVTTEAKLQSTLLDAP